MKVAEALKTWLPDVIQAVEPWVSSQDISKGSRGLREVASELAGSDFGIICVTSDNQSSQWVNFEAGALSKQIEESLVVPLLLDIKITNLTGPLAQFQATDSTSKDDFKKLVQDINSTFKETAIPPERLDRAFERNWPDLEDTLIKIRAGADPQPATPGRADSEILEELLVLARQQERRLVDLESLMYLSREDLAKPPNTAQSRRPTKTEVDQERHKLFIKANTALGHLGIRVASVILTDDELVLAMGGFPKPPPKDAIKALEFLADSAGRSISVIDEKTRHLLYRHDWPF